MRATIAVIAVACSVPDRTPEEQPFLYTSSDHSLMQDQAVEGPQPCADNQSGHSDTKERAGNQSDIFFSNASP
jgi:hypothetical protein